MKSVSQQRTCGWLTMASGEGVTCSRLARSALALASPWRADLGHVAVEG